MYKLCILMPFSTIFNELFCLYIAHEWTAQNLDYVSSLVALRSFSYWAPSLPKSRFAQERRAIERFQRAMCPALVIFLKTEHYTYIGIPFPGAERRRCPVSVSLKSGDLKKKKLKISFWTKKKHSRFIISRIKWGMSFDEWKYENIEITHF